MKGINLIKNKNSKYKLNPIPPYADNEDRMEIEKWPTCYAYQTALRG
jgi:hypothetical protein